MRNLIFILMVCCFCGACADKHGAQTQAGKIFVQFANAKTITSKSKYILYPQEMLPYMEQYYKTNINDTRLRDYKITAEHDYGEWVSLSILKGGRISDALMKKEKNTYKLDWQSYTRYTPTTIAEYEENEDPDKLFSMYVAAARGPAQLSQAISTMFAKDITSKYFFFVFVPSDIGQNVMAEKEAYEVDEWITGLCPKALENCQNLHSIFLRNKQQTSCLVSIKGHSLVPLVEKASTHKLSKQEKIGVLQMLRLSNAHFIEVTDITPSWFCFKKQR